VDNVVTVLVNTLPLNIINYFIVCTIMLHVSVLLTDYHLEYKSISTTGTYAF
jgi:hypothetical protein